MGWHRSHPRCASGTCDLVWTHVGRCGQVWAGVGRCGPSMAQRIHHFCDFQLLGLDQYLSTVILHRTPAHALPPHNAHTLPISVSSLRASMPALCIQKRRVCQPQASTFPPTLVHTEFGSSYTHHPTPFSHRFTPCQLCLVKTDGLHLKDTHHPTPFFTQVHTLPALSRQDRWLAPGPCA